MSECRFEERDGQAWCQTHGMVHGHPNYIVDSPPQILVTTHGALRAGAITAKAVFDAAGIPDEDRRDLIGGRLSREDFPDLYAVVRNNFGPTIDGRFELPDLRGRIVDRREREVDRLRARRKRDLADGVSAEAWGRSLLGDQLRLLEAWETLSESARAAFLDNRVGMWLGRWLFRRRPR